MRLVVGTMINLTARILGLGAIAGMRTMSAPALLVAYLRRQERERVDGVVLRFLTSPTAEWASRLLAAGELAADKVPGIPARIEPEPLFARALSGGTAGYLLSMVHGRSKGKGVVLGAAAAVGSAFAAYHARRALVESLSVPDPAVAILEDALVIGGGRRLMDL